MQRRTVAIGDIHGDMDALERVWAKLPHLTASDTIVFMGDYVDRGPRSRDVIDFVKDQLPRLTPARIVALRGNHEDGWLRVVDGGWPEFVMPYGNGCLQCLRSYTGGPKPLTEPPTADEARSMFSGSFFPQEHVAWMRSLAFYFEDEHAIYVHAGIPRKDGAWQHPAEVADKDKSVLLWLRTGAFFREYRGKRIVVGHTSTDCLPPELSTYTPEDPTDMWESECVLAIDTGCGKGGFLTAVELPSKTVYESRP